MTDSERQAKIDSYGKAHDMLLEALARFPKEMWGYRPTEDQWSIHEIVVHITDSEANSYVRCRRFLAEPGEALMAYDEMRWGRELNYQDQNPDDALELFRWLRKMSYDLIKTAPQEVWSRESFHPEDGVITMDDWLNTYQRHIPDHISQMESVHESWLEGRGGA
jgi:hypothetical protein